MEKAVNLNLACGADYKSGWINIDNKQMYHGEFTVDMDADVFELQWEDNTVDMILVSHFIQYVTPEKMDILLKRWCGWLKHGGVIYIEAGDILQVCQNILGATTIEELHGKNCIMQLYGIDENIWNKWAWCPASLTHAMDQAGFKELFSGRGFNHHNPKRDFVSVGYKVEEGKPFESPIFPTLLEKYAENHEKTK